MVTIYVFFRIDMNDYHRQLGVLLYCWIAIDSKIATIGIHLPSRYVKITIESDH